MTLYSCTRLFKAAAQLRNMQFRTTGGKIIIVSTSVESLLYRKKVIVHVQINCNSSDLISGERFINQFRVKKSIADRAEDAISLICDLSKKMFKNVMNKSYLRTLIRTHSVNSKDSIDVKEIDHFKQIASEWWNETGPMKPLHAMNKLRVPLIRDGLLNTNKSNGKGSQPLKGLSILDVGCGGGILTEALARIGPSVTGLDANNDLIHTATTHAQNENMNNLSYCSGSIEDHAANNKEKYDAVVASEVIEHVTKKEMFLKACVECLKPGGSIFVTTLNKTWFSYFSAIYLGETVFNILPPGTHDLEKFIQPHKLRRLLEDLNCETILVHGMGYNVFSNNWFWCQNSAVSYALHAVKVPNKT